MPINAIPVIYRPEQSVPANSYSPSSDKPRQVVADWLAHDMPIRIVRPEPLSPGILKRVHDAAYVDGIFDQSIADGFGSRDPAVAQALLHTLGAMALATRIAISHGIAVAPVSGFHHAGRAFGGGFCTFNGLIVAIEQASCDIEGERIHAGILDLDFHYGNGTQDIIDRGLPPGVTVDHFSAGEKYWQPSHAEALLEALPGIVERMAGTCDVILYQAGADQHVKDPLGGIFTTEQMRERDRIVFETFAAHQRTGTGLVWNLAGGYQLDAAKSIAPVLALHRITMQECVAVFVEARA